MIDGRVYKHRRRLRTKTKVAGVTIGLAVLTLSFLAYSFYPLFQIDSSFVSAPASVNEPSLASDLSNPSLVAQEVSTAPLVFPYSVIPGGAHSSRELLEAARREPVVAAHYAEFSVADARVIRLPHDKLAYVSYRLGNHIYWTKTKVKLHHGETLLSDGKHLARTRCGNRISDVAMAPVSPQEPPQMLLSTPFVPAHVERRPRFPRDRPDMARNFGRSRSHGYARHAACARPGPRLPSLPSHVLLRPKILARHVFLPLLSVAATWLPSAAVRDNSGAQHFPSTPLQSDTFASSGSLAAHSLDHRRSHPCHFRRGTTQSCRKR